MVEPEWTEQRDQRNVAQASSPAPRFATARNSYKRRLPHVQRANTTIFITFSTSQRWVLPESVRSDILGCCTFANGTRFDLHASVVMPDHVHLLLTPRSDPDGNTFPLAQITNSIKGASAHAVNKALNRVGRVWTPESFDRVLRSDESARSKAEYICANPVRAGLAASEDEYPWLWREWVEGSETR